MSNEELDEPFLEKDELREQYSDTFEEYSKDYLRLANILSQDIQKLLNDAKIDVLSVDYRIKDFEKFLEKITRKKYDDPLNDIKDLCGLRIICYYASDLSKIHKMIEEEFNVLEFLDKSHQLKEDRFGYLSRHYIVKIKEEWVKTPSYRDLDNLVAEIQVRTILEHAWANISHKLVYKNEDQVPQQFKRKLNSLSCILENSDFQFDSLREDREKYLNELSEALESGEFDFNQKLNLDTLQAFLDFRFPDKRKNLDKSADLLDEIIEFNNKYGKELTLKSISEAIDSSKDFITVREVLFKINSARIRKKTQDDLLKLLQDDPVKFKEKYPEKRNYAQVGYVRIALRHIYKEYAEFKRKKSMDQRRSYDKNSR